MWRNYENNRPSTRNIECTSGSDFAKEDLSDRPPEEHYGVILDGTSVILNCARHDRKRNWCGPARNLRES